MLIFVLLFGLVIGSFLNVCIYRVPRGLSIIVPPSQCPHCGTRLKPIDLVPVFSYLLLRGKCRYCKGKISPRYAVVELLTGIIFMLTYWRYGSSILFPGFSFLGAVMIATFFVDLEQMIIPDEFVITGLIGGAFFQTYCILSGSDTWWNEFAGALTGSGIFLMVAIISLVILKKEGMGGGDIKIMAVIGLFLGLRLILLDVFLSVVLGGIAGVFYLIFRAKNQGGTEIPFGPFIVAGTFICTFFGNEIIAWYLNSFF